jgi:hypothetical protein
MDRMQNRIHAANRSKLGRKGQSVEPARGRRTGRRALGVAAQEGSTKRSIFFSQAWGRDNRAYPQILKYKEDILHILRKSSFGSQLRLRT